MRAGTRRIGLAVVRGSRVRAGRAEQRDHQCRPCRLSTSLPSPRILATRRKATTKIGVTHSWSDLGGATGGPQAGCGTACSRRRLALAAPARASRRGSSVGGTSCAGHRRVDQRGRVVVDARGAVQPAARSQRHRLVALGPARPESGADRGRVARAHRREQVVLDVEAEAKREPLDQRGVVTREPLTSGSLIGDARAEAVVRQDERHHERVGDEERQHEHEQERHEPDQRGDGRPDARPRAAVSAIASRCCRGDRKPRLAREQQLVRALHGEAEDQAEHAAPAAAAERERIDREPRAARSRYSSSVG